MQNTDGNSRIAKNTLVIYLKTFLVLFVSLFTSRIVLQVLGVVDFGIYNVVAGLVAMFELLQSSLTSAVQRYYNFQHARNGDDGVRQVFSTTIIIQIILSVLIILIIESLGYWYLINKMVIPVERLAAAKFLFHTCSAILFLQILQIPYLSLIVAKEKMMIYALCGIIEAITKLLLIILLPFLPGDSLIIYSLMMLSIAIFSCLFYFGYCKINFGNLIKVQRYCSSLFVEMFKFVFWSATNGFANMAKNQGINMIMNYFFGPVVNAARGISYQVKSALVVCVSSMTVSARPQLVESFSSGDYVRSQNIMCAISKYSFYVIFVVALPIIVECNTILHLWLGESIPEHTISFVIWVILITLVDILCTPLNMIIYANGKIAKYNIIYSVISLLIIPLAIITFIYSNEPVYVFVESFIISLLLLVISLLFVVLQTPLKISLYWRKVLLPIIKVSLLSSIIFFISNYIAIKPIIHFFIFAPLTLLISILVIYMVGFNKNEKNSLKKLIKDKIDTFSNKM